MSVFAAVADFLGRLLCLLVWVGVVLLLWDTFRPRKGKRTERSARRALNDVTTVDDLARRGGWKQ